MDRYLGKFVAVNDNGEEREVEVYQEMVRNDIPGLKRLELVSGGSVGRLGKGRYRVAQTGEELTSSDPSAP